MWPHILLFGISGGEILILLLLVLILFGPKKIPEIARMVGRGMNEVKKVQREINSEIHRYSSDIENETKKMAPGHKTGASSQKQDIKASPIPSGDELGEETASSAPEAGMQSESPEDSSGEVPEGGCDDLPHPYKWKGGEGEGLSL